MKQNQQYKTGHRPTTKTDPTDPWIAVEAIFAEIKKIELRYRRGFATADDALRHLAQALVEPMMGEG